MCFWCRGCTGVLVVDMGVLGEGVGPEDGHRA